MNVGLRMLNHRYWQRCGVLYDNNFSLSYKTPPPPKKLQDEK